MRALLLHITAAVACVAAGSVGLAQTPNPKVLEVSPISNFEAPECGLGAPKTVFIFITKDRNIWIGNEAGEPVRFRDRSAIAAEFQRLKDERPDRVSVAVEVKDGVTLSTLSQVIDLLYGVEMNDISIVTGRDGSQFDPDRWARPTYRNLLPVPPRAH